MITELTVERSDMEFTTPDGDVVRTVGLVSFTGTLTGMNGQDIPYSGHFRAVDDFQANTTTITGLSGRAVLPDGEVVLAAGRRVTDLDSGIGTVAGANTFGEFVDDICTAFVA